MSFADMVTNSVLARAVAIFLLALVFTAAVGVGTYDLLIGRNVPAEINTIIGGGITFAITLLGINYGVLLQPMTPKKPAAPTTGQLPPAQSGGTNTNGSNP